jgi:thioredoxin reductase (NADPH)
MNSENGAGAAQVYDIAIIGSGPAGYTAAIYAARANLQTVLFQGEVPGGQLTITSEVENYPGYENGILGPEMMDKFEVQAKRFGAEMIFAAVTRVDLSHQPFRLWTSDGEYRASAVIVATGASARWLGLPNEQRLRNRGVSACATCDGFFFRGKDVAVVGGGDTAMEEALFLTRYANHVYLIHRRDTFRASKIMQLRALQHPKITILYNTIIEDLLGENVVEGLRLRNLKTDRSEPLKVQGLFVAIGHQPNTEIFRGVLAMDELGYLIPVKHTMASLPGVFIAGDVADRRYRQAVTAAGDGCRAAIDAERWLEARGEVDESVVRDPRDYGVLHDSQSDAQAGTSAGSARS